MSPRLLPALLVLPLLVLPVAGRTADDAGCARHLDGAPAGLLVRVEKSAFRLGVYRDGALVDGANGAMCYPIALGAEPRGDKVRRGDERTPEGTFRITHRNPASAFHLSLGLDYPSARYGVAAYAEGRIDAATRDRIVAASARKGMPPRDTPLGGDIYLHGGGAWPQWWTDGCVAVANDAMDALYAIAGPGTRVDILP